MAGDRVAGVVGRRSFKSSSNALAGIGLVKGMYWQRNFLLCSVTRQEPSSLTTYWSNRCTSIMVLVLSHLLGVMTNLILDSDVVTYSQRWEVLSVF